MTKEEIITELRCRLRRDKSHVIWGTLVCYEEGVSVTAENIAKFIFKPTSFVNKYRELWFPYCEM